MSTQGTDGRNLGLEIDELRARLARVTTAARKVVEEVYGTYVAASKKTIDALAAELETNA